MDPQVFIQELANAITSHNAPTVEVPRFSGGEQDPVDWVTEFITAAINGDWSQEKMAKHFGVYMKDLAKSWYIGLPMETKLNWNELVGAFNTKFVTGFYREQIKQQLEQCKQNGTSLEHYVAKLLKLCHKTDANMHDVKYWNIYNED